MALSSAPQYLGQYVLDVCTLMLLVKLLLFFFFHRNNKNPVCKKCKEDDPSTVSEESILTSEHVSPGVFRAVLMLYAYIQ